MDDFGVYIWRHDLPIMKFWLSQSLLCADHQPQIHCEFSSFASHVLGFKKGAPEHRWIRLIVQISKIIWCFVS